MPFSRFIKGLLAGATLIFVSGLLGQFVSSMEYARQIDRWVLLTVVSYRADTLNEVMRWATFLGSAHFLLPVTLATALWSIRIRAVDQMQVLFGAALAWGFLNYPMKVFFGRVRPDIVPALVFEPTPAYPSGHTLGVALLLPALVLSISNARWRKICAILSGFLIFAVGLSRIYLGAHWPSDVTASLLASLVFWWCAFPYELHWKKAISSSMRRAYFSGQAPSASNKTVRK